MQTLLITFWQKIQREIVIQIRQKKAWINTALFFAMILFIFPLTLPADPNLERVILPGTVWVALLVAQILSAERLFQVDYDEGVIEAWLVSGQPMTLMIAAKVLVHWVLTLIPLLGLIPCLALLYHLSFYASIVLICSLICGSLPMVLLVALAGAFTVVLSQKGVVVGLVILPLIVPILILGAAATSAAMMGLPTSAHLAYLLALSCLSLAGLPCAIAAVIRTSMT